MGENTLFGCQSVDEGHEGWAEEGEKAEGRDSLSKMEEEDVKVEVSFLGWVFLFWSGGREV